MHDMMNNLQQVDTWMRDHIADLLEVAPSEVATDRSFDHLGLDSVATVTLASDLGRWIGTKLDVKLLIEHPTIDALSAHLRERHGQSAAV
jgi:acyl carrier protein